MSCYDDINENVWNVADRFEKRLHRKKPVKYCGDFCRPKNTGKKYPKDPNQVKKGQCDQSAEKCP